MPGVGQRLMHQGFTASQQGARTLEIQWETRRKRTSSWAGQCSQCLTLSISISTEKAKQCEIKSGGQNHMASEGQSQDFNTPRGRQVLQDCFGARRASLRRRAGGLSTAGEGTGVKGQHPSLPTAFFLLCHPFHVSPVTFSLGSDRLVQL